MLFRGKPLINPGAVSDIHAHGRPVFDLVNLQPGIPEPGAADVNLRMQIGRDSDQFVVNGVTFKPPTQVLLFLCL